jgi:[acyl-carrier-protein] S-malonyltransferase
MALAFVFPGQGSQSVGMLRTLADASPLIAATFSEASEILGYDLWQLCQQGPDEMLNTTERTQPAMLAADVATYRLWRAQGGAAPQLMAGHSLGEFAALVCAGALDFGAAIDLVRFRGQAMQKAVPTGIGAMAAILGLDDADIEAVCREAAQSDVVEPVNYNAPSQVVIAGHASAVARAIEAAKARGAKRAILLPVSVPSHSSLMLPAAEQLRQRLATTAVSAPNCTVFGVDVAIHRAPDAVRAGLVRQLHTPVRWAATVGAMIEQGATNLVECGPGKVLTGLNRRIDKNKDIGMYALEDPDSLRSVIAALRER